MSRTSIAAGWLLDGSGAPARKDVVLIVESGRIHQVREAGDASIQTDQVIDFSDCTLLPGLIDAHVHLFISGTADPTTREKQLSLPFEEVKKGIERRLRALMAHGVVACRDGGDRHAWVMRYKQAHLAGNPCPITLKAAGAAWHQEGRYGRTIGRSPLTNDGLADSISRLGQAIDHVKIVNSGLNSLLHFGRETAPQFSVSELKQAVAAGESLGCKTMVHANGGLPVESALKAGCHSIEHGFFMGTENLRRMADRQICWVPTAVTMKAYRETLQRRDPQAEPWDLAQHPSRIRIVEMAQVASRNLDHQLEQMRLAKDLGVLMAVGTDAGSPGVHHGRSMASEIGLFMTAGFSAEAAVRCATLNSARLLGLKNCGRLDKGMAATFMAVPGSPHGLPHSLHRVSGLYVDGKPVNNFPIPEGVGQGSEG